MLRRNMMASSAGGGDPHWASVVSLLHFDGTDGSTSFPDQTTRVWTPSGNVQIDTGESMFGGASCQFDGDGDYLTTPSDAALSASGGVDMTWEMWVRPATSKAVATIATRRPVSGASTEWWIANEYNVPKLILWDNNVAALVLTTSEELVTNAWSHLAFTIASGVGRLFVNGTLSGTASVTGSVTSNSRPVIIGRDPTNSGRDFDGHIDDYRQTRGVARYTSSFSPPSAPFPDHGP